MREQDEAAYRAEVEQLRREYEGEMRIYLGLELEGQDDRLFPKGQYDYFINSVHYVKANGVYYPMDESPETLEKCIREGFGGDAYLLAKTFFQLSAETACKRKPDIIGHFDLLTRYNGAGRFFDEESNLYQSIAIEAVREAIHSGGIFEINSGAISRGIKDRIYPSMFLLKEIRRLGGRVILSSDAHRAEHLDFAFPFMTQLLLEAGFQTMMCLTETGWEEIPIC